jgi:hypothetical protein
MMKVGLTTKALHYRMRVHHHYRLPHPLQIEIHGMWWLRKSKTRISGGQVSGQLFIMTRKLTSCQTLIPWRAAGSLAHHHIPGLTFIGTLILTLMSILTPTPIPRIYLIHHSPMVTFASQISRACLVFVRKARLRAKFLYQVCELSSNPSL